MEISKAEILSAAAASTGAGNSTQELMGAEVLVKAGDQIDAKDLLVVYAA